MTKSKPVVDFQAKLISKLRTEKNKANASAQALVEASRANMNNGHRVQGLILCLLDAAS